MIQEAIKQLLQKENLSQEQMQSVMEEIMSGKAETPTIVSFLTALSDKIETVDEITAAVSVMRKFATKISAKEKLILDTCGTGGDKKSTFNVSTAVAFVAAGAGITVAKHGNRSVSSCCGSADILEELGVNINIPKEKIEKCLETTGIAFLFAPNLHPAMKYAMPARKEIGKRTIFNILGPLANPAGANHQLIGVFEPRLTEIVAQVLANLGSVHALVVHGEGGFDEVTTTDSTFVAEVRKGKIKKYYIAPEDFGFRRARQEDLRGGTIKDNAGILLDILKGKKGLKQDIVLLNAGCAIYAADRAKTIEEGITQALVSINSGKAMEKLELLKECSKL